MPDANSLLFGTDAQKNFWSKPQKEQINQLVGINPSLKGTSESEWGEFLSAARSKAEKKGILSAPANSPSPAPDSTPAPKPADDTSTIPATRPPSSAPAQPEQGGILHAVERGVNKSLIDVDRAGESVFGMIAQHPGLTIGDKNQTISSHLSRWAREARERHQKYLDEDDKKGGGPKTTGEKITEGVAGSAGRVALLAGTRSPLGMAAVDTVTHASEGPKSALGHGVETYISGRALGAVGDYGEKVLSKVPVFSYLPSAARRAVGGAAVGAIHGAVSGNLEDAASGSIIGGAMSALQRKELPDGSTDPIRERYARYRSLSSDLDALREKRDALPHDDPSRDEIRSQMEDKIRGLVDLDETGRQSPSPTKHTPPQTTPSTKSPKVSPENPKVASVNRLVKTANAVQDALQATKESIPLTRTSRPGHDSSIDRLTGIYNSQRDLGRTEQAQSDAPPASRPAPETKVLEAMRPAPEPRPASEYLSPGAERSLNETPQERSSRILADKSAEVGRAAMEKAKEAGRRIASIDQGQSPEAQQRLAESLVDELEKRRPPPTREEINASKRGSEDPPASRKKVSPVTKRAASKPRASKVTQAEASPTDKPVEVLEQQAAVEPQQSAPEATELEIHEPTHQTVKDLLKQYGPTGDRKGVESVDISNGNPADNPDVTTVTLRPEATPEEVRSAVAQLGESTGLHITPTPGADNPQRIRGGFRSVPKAKIAASAAGLPEPNSEIRVRSPLRGYPADTSFKYIGRSTERPELHELRGPDGAAILVNDQDLAELQAAR